jgi:hypothetical protein
VLSAEQQNVIQKCAIASIPSMEYQELWHGISNTRMSSPTGGRHFRKIGGDKTGGKRFYKRMVPIADDLYDVHLVELRKEGLIK